MHFKDFMIDILLVAAFPAIIFLTYKAYKLLDSAKDSCSNFNTTLSNADKVLVNARPVVKQADDATDNLKNIFQDIAAPLKGASNEGLERMLTIFFNAVINSQR